MPDKDQKGHEIIPVSSKIPATIQLWNIRFDRKTTVRILGVLTLLTGAGWCFQEFSQLRGWVSVLASRIFLGLFGAFLFAIWCIISAGFKQTHVGKVIGAIVIAVALYGIDKIAPNPTLIVTPSKAELLSRAATLTANLRKLQRNYNVSQEQLSNSYGQRIQAASRKDRTLATRLFHEEMDRENYLAQDLEMQFGPLRAQAINLERDLLQVLPRQKDPVGQIAVAKQRTVRLVLDRGVTSGASPLYELADYIDTLADQLR